MLRISFPCSRDKAFLDAVNVLEECKVRSLPCCGFVNEFMGPGGYYGNCWWERDSSLTLSGYKWIDQDFAEKALLNFIGVQKENGRIPLWGHDAVEDIDPELSALPFLFEVARKICRRTDDRDYIEKIYLMLSRYMDWWQSEIKKDSATGLVCGIFEESDPSDFRMQREAAQVDLNVQTAIGADVLSEMARYLGRNGDGERYQKLFEDMKKAVNKYLWSDADGMYFTRFTESGKLYTERVQNSMFDTFKHKICGDDRAGVLMKHLKNNALFAWDGPFGLTTLSKTCGQYEETVGVYQGYHSWSGNIWSIRNKIIAEGLLESGYPAEAAHLAMMTLDIFGKGFPEFASPSDGKGHGVYRYGWSASNYIELIVEVIFGIDYCAWNDTLAVRPNIPKELYGEKISLENLCLKKGRYANVYVSCSEVPEVRYEIYEA